jgi:hypothetical protein
VSNTNTPKLYNMRYYKNCLYLALILIITGSCKKDKIIEPSVILPKEVTGDWVWISTYLNGPLGPNNPYTPLNTGNTEKLVFNSNKEWKRFFNSLIADSGTFNLEHGRYINPSNTTFIYDQINYFRNGNVLDADWYEIHNDTLLINPGYRGYFTSYNMPYVGGSKRFIKQ